MKVISAATVLAVTVLLVHTSGASAQQPAPEAAPAPAPAPAPAAPAAVPAPQAAYPPGYGPPPGYAQAPAPVYAPPSPQPSYYPPPRGYGAPPPRYSYYPPPPPPPATRPVTDRAFTIGGSLGFGSLSYVNDNLEQVSDVTTGYSFRLGFGITPRSIFLIGLDGAITSDDIFVYNQTVYYVGLQYFLSRHFFLRGGVGVGNITERESATDFVRFGRAGLGLTGTAGFEVVQGYNWSLELAAQFTGGFYRDDEQWGSYTINVGVNFF
jgi:hypothetical protein